MNPTTARFLRLSLVSGLLLSPITPGLVSAQDSPVKPPHEKGEEGPRGDHRQGSDPFHDLTPEQRESLREAISRAWSDPSVIEARDELKSAAEVYQKSLNQAIARIDPELAKAVTKMRRDSTSALKIYGQPGRGPGHRPGGGGGGNGGSRNWREFDGMVTLESPSFLRDATEEQKESYRDAHRQAMNDPTVKKMMEQMEGFRQEDDALRKQRVEVIRKTHQAVRAAIIKADPAIAEWLPERTPRSGNEPNSRPPSSPGSGPGKGPDRKRPPSEPPPPLKD